ncbi:MAG: AsmA family protein [Desulfovibrionales bacterium]
MKKFLKITGIVAGILVLLLVLGIVLLVTFVDPNDYKDDISRAARDATGREVTFHGDMSFTFFPWLGLELGSVSMSNARGFENDDFARIGQAKINVRVFPLLQRELEMDTIVLNDLVLHLEKNAQGRTNWDDLAQQEENATAEQQPQGEQPGRSLQELNIGGVEINNALVTWDDRQAEQSFELGNVNLSTGEIAFGDLFQFTLAFDFTSTQPRIASRTEMSGQMLLDPNQKSYAVKPVAISSRLQGQDIPGESITLTAKGYVQADMMRGTATITDLSLQTLDEISLLANLEITGLNEELSYSGRVNLPKFDPQAVMQKLGINIPATGDPNVLKAFSSEAKFTGNSDSATIQSLQAVLDQTTINGNGAVTSFERPAYTFALTVDQIDLDRYLPPTPETEAQTPRDTPSAEQGDPLEPLRDLRLKGQADVGSLTVKNIKTSDITVSVTARDGLLTVDPYSLALYGGSLSGTARLDARTTTPSWSFTEKMNSVDIGPLVQDFMDKDLIAGTAAMAASLSGSGIEPDTIMKSLNGEVNFRAADGAVKGVNIPLLIRQAKARITGAAAPEEVAAKQTDFSDLSGSATITDGLIKNDDFLMQSPLLRVRGKGTVDLPQEEVDYLVNAALVGTLEGQGGAGVEELRDVPVPLRITGTFDQLAFRPDMEVLAREFARTKVGGEVQKKLEETEKQLQQKLREKLPFGGGSGDQNATGDQSPTPSLPGLDLFKRQ